METVWASRWNGKYRESVDVESRESKLRVLQGKVVSRTGATTRVYRSDGRGPDN